jgi:glycosyltransferase involved in cell wall biosynthesis
MNVLQVTPTEVYPPQNGGDNRRHGLVEAFVAAGDTVVRYTQSASLSETGLRGRKRLEIEDGYVEHRNNSILSTTARASSLLDVSSGPLFGIAFTSSHSEQLGRLVRWADVIIVEGPYQLSTMASIAGDTPVVYSSHNVEQELYSTGQNALLKPIVARQERNAVSSADLVVCVSERDERRFRNLYDFTTPTVVVPNGVPDESISTDSRAGTEIRKRYGIPPEATVGLFIGSNHSPNVEAVEQFLKTVRDRRRSTDDFRLLVVGSVGDSLSHIPEWTVTVGHVEDVEPYFDASDIGLNPMLSGSGSNIKLLDYFAHGLPVLSTPFGARGINVRSGEHLVIANIDEFYYRLQDGDWEETDIGRTAQSLVAEQYTWRRLSKSLREAIVKLV